MAMLRQMKGEEGEEEKKEEVEEEKEELVDEFTDPPTPGTLGLSPFEIKMYSFANLVTSLGPKQIYWELAYKAICPICHDRKVIAWHCACSSGYVFRDISGSETLWKKIAHSVKTGKKLFFFK